MSLSKHINHTLHLFHRPRIFPFIKSNPKSLNIKAFSTATTNKKSSFAELTREYGLLSIVVYSSLALPTFCGCLYAITYMGVTQKDISQAFNKIKSFFGIPVTSPPPPNQTIPPADVHFYHWLPDWMKTEQAQNLMTNALLAMGMTKLFSPIKFGLTALIVPPLGRRLKMAGWIKSAATPKK